MVRPGTRGPGSHGVDLRADSIPTLVACICSLVLPKAYCSSSSLEGVDDEPRIRGHGQGRIAGALRLYN